MGQEWSWPCASRDLQEKRIAEGKYDFGFLEEDNNQPDDRHSNKQRKIAKIEKVILSRNFSADSTTPSPSIAATPYSFTDDSYYDQDENVVVVCEAIDDFDAFMASNMKKYNNVNDIDSSYTKEHGAKLYCAPSFPK